MNPLTFLYWILVFIAFGTATMVLIAVVLVFDAWRERRRIINDYKKRG